MNILLLLLAMVQDQTSVAIETKDNSGDGKGAWIVSSYNIYLGLNSTFDTFLSSHIFNSKIFVSPSQQLQKNGKMWDLFPKSATKWWWWLWWWSCRWRWRATPGWEAARCLWGQVKYIGQLLLQESSTMATMAINRLVSEDYDQLQMRNKDMNSTIISSSYVHWSCSVDDCTVFIIFSHL